LLVVEGGAEEEIGTTELEAMTLEEGIAGS
jgi:hypothetical protein